LSRVGIETRLDHGGYAVSARSRTMGGAGRPP